MTTVERICRIRIANAACDYYLKQAIKIGPPDNQVELAVYEFWVGYLLTVYEYLNDDT
jgi:hypothetical protein